MDGSPYALTVKVLVSGIGNHTPQFIIMVTHQGRLCEPFL